MCCGSHAVLGAVCGDVTWNGDCVVSGVVSSVGMIIMQKRETITITKRRKKQHGTYPKLYIVPHNYRPHVHTRLRRVTCVL